MLQGFIVLLAVVTFVLMAADPRDSGAQATQSAWQKNTSGRHDQVAKKYQ
ncbi:Uncharacterised protein [Acinetobacter baumannii]|nr:Uncharacterised protein [Acinetobacter baumannii]